MFRSKFPFLGFGAGLRRPHYRFVIEKRPPIGWLELISENFMVAGGRPREVLDQVRERYPIVLHGVSMSLGSTDPLSRNYLKELRDLVRRAAPAWVSDHLCWTGVGGHNLHDLLPLPYTTVVVRHVAGRIRLVQDYLERPILIENVSSYMSYTQSSMTEWEFLAAVADQADCGILLDINNVYVSAHNHGFDPIRYLDSVPAERVVQYHLAGHSNHGAYLLDSHDHPVCEDVWALYQHAVRRFGRVSALIEWDDHIPDFDVLLRTAGRARKIYESYYENTRRRSNRDGTQRTPAPSLPAHHRA